MGIQGEDGFSVIAILCGLAIGAGKNQRPAMTASSAVRLLRGKMHSDAGSPGIA
jgi:hypothetical protein